MSIIKNRLLLLYLEDPALKTDDNLHKKYNEIFGKNDDGQEVYQAIKDLARHDVLIDFDPEYEAFNDFISLTHKEHGDIEFSDVEIQGMDSFLALGPKSLVMMMENADELAETAVDLGLSKALGHLRNLPVDASKWTGLPSGFHFTKEIQVKVIDTLQKAQTALDGITLSNAERARASAYIDCALIMAQLPDPEPDIVALMVQRLLILVGVVGVFADLKGIFS